MATFNIPISLSLSIVSFTLNQDSSKISHSFTWATFWSISISSHLTNILLQLFLNFQPATLNAESLLSNQHTVTAFSATLNAESLLSKPISVNLAWSNFMFLPPLSHTLNIYSHTCSLDLCLYKLENSSSSFGPTLYLTFRVLLILESSYKSRSKEVW